MIRPTIGRVVWYRPSKEDGITRDVKADRLAAIIALVHSDSMVNLAVFDADGMARSRTSVKLHQEDGVTCPPGACEWMPYQKAVAAGEIPAVQHKA